jgi:hypothetical protein
MDEKLLLNQKNYILRKIKIDFKHRAECKK